MIRTKAAWIRDEGYPVGQLAPGHFVCCGQHVPATLGASCSKCGTQFDANGWIIEAGKATCALCHENPATVNGFCTACAGGEL
jgi:hypothetical protein